MSQKKDTAVSFSAIPVVPQDFEGAVAAHRESIKALQYWKEKKRYARFSDEQIEANRMVQKWESVQDTADRIIQSYQLKLF